MPTYTYLAKKNLNEKVEGIIMADSQDNAVDKLIEMGLSPIKVEPLVTVTPKEKGGALCAHSFRRARFPRKISISSPASSKA